MASVILKQIHPPASEATADRSQQRSHQRKVRSYQVERTWYSAYSQDCGQTCRVPRFFAEGQSPEGDWLLLEDLDLAGYPERRRVLSPADIQAVLHWLAHFHAGFLGKVSPASGSEYGPKYGSDLWEEGSYWHLDTRPDEWQALPTGPLKAAATTIAAKLKQGHFHTLIHGDAKPANFCFSANTDAHRDTPIQVAAVDFQYIGRGCGMKDLAYFLSACFPETQAAAAIPRHVDLYFGALKQALQNPSLAEAVEAEWRELFDWAWLDFYRFELGWLGGNPQNYP